MERIPASKARERLSDVLDKVSLRGGRVVLERHGKGVAAVISLDDLKLLEALEDRYDVEEAREALQERGRRLTWEGLKTRLKL